MCDSEHNLIVDMGCMKGIIPRIEGAIGIREGTIRDIAVISKVNKPVCFTITGFEKDQNGKQSLIYPEEKLKRYVCKNMCRN